MANRIKLDAVVFKLEVLTETFVALEEAVEHSENVLPKHYLYFPVKELKKILKELYDIVQE